MNSNKQPMLLLLCLTASFAMAQTSQLFFEKIVSIKNDVYKISAQELCTLLGITDQPIPLITAEQLKHEMSSNTAMLVINVLPEKYYNDCHIAGSINAPLPELVERAASWDRSQKIIIYCALDECDASQKACILLDCMGFTNVIEYNGGIREWFQLNYPTHGPALSDYLHTKGFISIDHAYKNYPDALVCSKQTRWIN